LVGGLLVKAVRNIKWQLVASCTLLTLFMGTMAIYDVSLPAGITLSLFAGAATGYVEIITMVGGPMMVDPEFMGIAVGAQSTLRALMNSVARKNPSHGSFWLMTDS
jgi:acyl CoA:acetate/3-ketoacid CoA transferase